MKNYLLQIFWKMAIKTFWKKCFIAKGHLFYKVSVKILKTVEYLDLLL